MSNHYPFTLPPLPYAENALEPVIDARTMNIHHTKHHNAYVTNLNAALEPHADLHGLSLDELCRRIASLPDGLRNPVRNNGGGAWNHTMFWSLMAAPGTGLRKPSGSDAMRRQSSSSESPCRSAWGSSAALRFVTYALWCLV